MTGRCVVSNAQLEQKINELMMAVYTRAYKTTLEGLTVLIPKTQHQLGYVRGANVFNHLGKQVRVGVRIYENVSVQVTSNIPLDGHTIIIY